MTEKNKPFEYNDSPDGEDIIPKLLFVLKPATMFAIAASSVDVALYSHPKGYLPTIARFLHCSWPVFGVAGAFVLTQNMAGSIRQKDDPINWALGGGAAGAVFGLWRKSVHKSVSSVFVGAVLGALYKYSVQRGYYLMPRDFANPQIGGIRSIHQDWTLTKERPANWTTGE